MIGLTDEEVGFSSTSKKPESPDTATAKTSGRPTTESALGSPTVAGASPPDEPHRQVSSSSGSSISHRGDSARDTSLAVETEPRASEDSDAELPGGTGTGLKDEDVTLEDLAATASGVPVLPGRRRTTQWQSSRSLDAGYTSAGIAQEGRGRKSNAPDDGGDKRRGSGSTREGPAQDDIGRRGAGGRRGTDECSLYFRSDDGYGGGEDRRMPSPSRRTSTMSSGSVGGSGGRGRRTVYLGRTQAFPLRRVESSLAVDARGFGLSGVSAEKAVGEVHVHVVAKKP